MAKHAVLTVICAVGLYACDAGETIDVVEIRVDPALKPFVDSVADLTGAPQPVAAVRASDGKQGALVEGVLRLWPQSDAQRNEFLSRFGGVIIDNNEVAQPPPERGVTLTEAQRRATEFVVRIDLQRVGLSSLEQQAYQAGWRGRITFSSDAGRRTFAAALAARSVGYEVDANFIGQGAQEVLLRTQERPTGPGIFFDALTEPRYGAGGDAAQANIGLAWQFFKAHGATDSDTEVAIVDTGFYLTPQGTALGTDSDFPLGRIWQTNISAGGGMVDGPAPNGFCGGNNCAWHGTGSTGVAVGVMNNALGRAGTGSVAATPMLYKINASLATWDKAMLAAAAWGADVITLSVNSGLSSVSLTQQLEAPVMDRILARGFNPIFVASAGNQGVDVGYYFRQNGQLVATGTPQYPCVAPHVICVGALNNNSLNPATFTPPPPSAGSNFGVGVDIFAPTNIPIMSMPDNNNVGYGPQTFGGTSASAPFVAGVAAMMKAINPKLSSDDAAAILIATGTNGNGQAKRAVNAYAAVRRTAEGIPIVPDRLEPNNTIEMARDLGAGPSHSVFNMNLDATDRDFFAFTAPGPMIATIDLQYPQGLGPISVRNLHREIGFPGACPEPSFISRTPHGDNTGYSEAHYLSSGRHIFEVRANDVNAYNLTVSLAGGAVPMDDYEFNDTVASATREPFFLLRPTGGFADRISLRPIRNVSWHATIDSQPRGAPPATSTDADYYSIRGLEIARGAGYATYNALFLPFSGVRVYGNEAPVTLSVYRRNKDGSLGAQVAGSPVSTGPCGANDAVVELTPGESYYVQVTGAPGRYSVHNGTQASRIAIPWLQRSRIYIILNPGEPIEQRIRNLDRYFITVADRAFAGLRASKAGVHLRLLDVNQVVVSEGTAAAAQIGESLSFANTRAGEVYVVEATATDPGEQSFQLSWERAESQRTSDNLIVNSGAEAGAPESIEPEGWMPMTGLPPARIAAYSESDYAPPSSAPGPEDRGRRLFVGGEGARSALRQVIHINSEWVEPIRSGHVSARFSAYLGGHRDKDDAASAVVTFLDPNLQSLGSISLEPVTSAERGGVTGLLRVEAEGSIPVDTASLSVEFSFRAATEGINNAYADNLELTLSEHAE
ncbi:S8/S53 family peptidase [Methylococcus sp. EFPC2]|uniref:S8/S53 family peptidase n=1 Tax=Methylococcus sp. EFPC2 TaxID=2812648 RepID=UPI001967C5B3|nr:S8/S53 family peptidase [Methylococcus sp. EFPC2]QSA97773.1 S8/S53 family peptidase [Methylococcus sp. EFPC2]